MTQPVLDGGVTEPCVYTIENVNVIPGNGDKMLMNQDVSIYCGEIRQIKPHQAENLNDSSDIYIDQGNVINGSGKYLMPSFSDAHVHLPAQEELKNFFKMNLINGVTTLRSMRGEPWHLDIDQSDKLCPRLFLGSVPIEESSNFSLDSISHFIRSQKIMGFDFIKILGVDSPSSFQNVIHLAKASGIPLAGHCPRNINLRELCYPKNYMSVEHLGGLSDFTTEEDLVKMIKKTVDANLFHCATLSWTYALSRSISQLRKKEGLEYISDETISNWEKSLSELGNQPEEQQALYRKRIMEYFKKQQQNLKVLYKNGGLILIGPDASDEYMIPGFDYHLELQQHAQLGMSNNDLITAACYNMSLMFEETEEWGVIKTGSKTDMLLLEANPLDDISNSQKIQGIFLKGNYHTIEELKQMD